MMINLLLVVFCVLVQQQFATVYSQTQTPGSYQHQIANRLQQTIYIGACRFVLNRQCPDPDVTFFMYSTDHPENPEPVYIATHVRGTNLEKTSFDPQKPTKVIIHGYNSNMFLSALTELRKEYLKTNDYNIFVVDWSPLNQSPCYPGAVWNAPHVGTCIAQLVDRIRDMGAVDIHAIGFSLGAHITNYLSLAMRPYRLPRITGLDPAILGFITSNNDLKLDKSDAEFVDVYHTHAFMQGKAEESGHVDFYFNGGSIQLRCWGTEKFVNLVPAKIHEYSREKLQEMCPEYGTDIVLFPGNHGSPVVGYLKMDSNSSFKCFGCNMSKDVKFKYFSRDHPHGVSITSEHDLQKYVNRTKPTKFVTHGWRSGGDSDFSKCLRNGFLHRYDANIFVVDWSAIATNLLYSIPAFATPEVGKHCGTYLNYLVDEVGVRPKDIHLVGHSLGAHVSGYAGREVKKGKIGRITGLDPALPLFDSAPDSPQHLNVNDAHFVDVIHTCAGYLGYKRPLGHADFYPNGGGPKQPGCNGMFPGICSHSRSWQIFGSSLVSEQPYIATKCENLLKAKKGRCYGEETPMGDPTPANTQGIFYSKVDEDELIIKIVY